MPVVPLGTTSREVLSTFLGVNLRRDGLSLADEDVVRAINADLHRQPGTIWLRKGRSLQNAANLGSAIRTLDRHETRRYQVAGTALYRNFTSILTGLHATTLVTTLVPARPLNDTTTWSFIADQAVMRKDNGTTVHLWGIVAPAVTPTLAAGAAGSLTGTYGARYTYARVVGSSVAHESNPCPVPGTVGLVSETLDIPVVASADPQVTHIRVYRTIAGGTAYLFDQQVANANATINSSQADSALGTELETDNDPPELAAWVTEFQGHLFTCLDPSNPHYLWYSKRFRPEAFPPDQFLEIGHPYDPLQCAVPMTGLLGVFARTTKYRLIGNSVSGFTALEALNTRGTPAPQATLATSRGVGFVARDGLFLTNFVEGDVEISQALQALFYGETVHDYAPIDWSATAAMTLAEYKRRLYFGYQDTDATRMLAVYSLDTQRWYHYQHPVNRLFVEESTDTLTMGDTSGQVWVLESGTRDHASDIALSVTLPTRAMGDRLRQKGYEWLGVDADPAGGTWQARVSIDGTLATTQALSGSARERRWYRLPDDLAGQTWHAQLDYTGHGNAALYAVEMRERDVSIGQVWVEHPIDDNTFVTLLPGVTRAIQGRRQRMDFLTLDAEAVSGGLWTLRLYVDAALAATVEVAGDSNRRMLHLPAGLAGYQWYVRARYSSTPSPEVHGCAVLDTGPADGQVWLASALDPAGTYLDVLPARDPFDPFVRKRYQYLKFDAESAAGPWALALYIDDVLRYTLTVPGTRNRQLRRLPPNLVGSTWHLRATYAGATPPVVYAAQVLAASLKVA